MTENVELYDNKCRILCIKLTIMDAPTLCNEIQCKFETIVTGVKMIKTSKDTMI